MHYNPTLIPLSILIRIHLHTHASTKNHSFREKYRSAVYVFDGEIKGYQQLIADCQVDFGEPIITQVLLFKEFRLNDEQQLDYYQKHKEGVFCKRYIHPRLKMMETAYAGYFKKI